MKLTLKRALPIAAAFVVVAAQMATAQIVIDKMWSTTYDYSKVQELSHPGIQFAPGSALTASVNVTAARSEQSKAEHDLIGIRIQENQVHQMVDAFGGGITDSVAITLQDFKAKHPKDYNDLLHLLFSPDPEWWARGGVGLNSVRVPLGACDFGVSPYTYDDTEDGSEDMKLELFTIKKAPKLWMTLQDITAINPALKIFTAPWSAPGWMKENTNKDQPLFGGNLKQGMEEVFAEYLIKSIVTIKREVNLNIYALSLLNEPQIPELPYPTMKMSVEQSVKVGKLVRAGLNRAGLSTVKLLAYDFNWDNTQYPLAVLDASPTTWQGIAWHGYAGEPRDQKIVADAYPNKETYFTEYTEVTQYFSEPYKNMKNTARNLVMGSIRYASRSLILWNLVLHKDEDGFTSPHLPNVCDNCNAAVLLLPESTDANLNSGDPNHIKTVAEANNKPTDAQTGGSAPSRESENLSRRSPADTVALQPRIPASGGGSGRASEAISAKDVVDAKKTGTDSVYTSSLFKRTSDFSVLSHLSTAVRPVGSSKRFSTRIGVNSTDETSELGGRLLAQAFRQDGVKPGVTRFSVVLLNQNDHYETGVWEKVTAVIAFRGLVANVTTVPGLYTLSWEAPTVAPSSETQEEQSDTDGGPESKLTTRVGTAATDARRDSLAESRARDEGEAAPRLPVASQPDAKAGAAPLPATDHRETEPAPEPAS